MDELKRGMVPQTLPAQSRTIAAVMARFWEILLVATRLGLTSFGGPVAHIGYFRDEYVVRRKWLDEGTFAELIALCQFLPGPASSQLGMAVGIKRGGLLGGFAAWLGFTLPSALALILFAYGVQELGRRRAPIGFTDSRSSPLPSLRSRCGGWGGHLRRTGRASPSRLLRRRSFSCGEELRRSCW